MHSINYTNSLQKVPLMFEAIHYIPQAVVMRYTDVTWLFMASHVLMTIFPTVDMPCPNKAAIVRYSTSVASFQMMTTSLASTVTGYLKRVTAIEGEVLTHCRRSQRFPCTYIDSVSTMNLHTDLPSPHSTTPCF